MSEYSGIRGTRVKYLASDPTLNTSTEGQVWYNSTSGTLKSLVQIKAWSSGANLSTARRGSGAMGTQTAGAIAGGQAAPGYVNSTEEYSGFNWASGGNLNTTRAFLNNGTVGTQTAGLVFGGEGPPDLGATEEYDGSTWTSNPTGLNTVRRDLGGVGIQTAALAFGGTSSPTAVTESYDGSSWTTSPGTLNTGRASLVGAGTQTAALAIGGPSTVVESWDGSSWTNGPSLNFQLDGGAGASGTQTNALTFGGRTPPGTTLVSSSEQYDGNTWVTTPSMATARRELMGMGTAQSGLATGGFTPPTFSASTEEYVSSIDAYSPSTVSAWASGGSYPSTAVSVAGAGTQTAAIGFGGYDPGGDLATSYEYDGSTWTSSGSLSAARQAMGSAVSAPQSTALSFGGYGLPGPPFATTVTDEYNGSTWTTGGNMNTGRDNAQGIGFGIQTAAVAAGGSPPASGTEVEEYNGSTWTVSGTAMPEGKKQNGSMGVSTAGAVFGGFNPSPAVTGSFLEYNGSTWTTGSPLSTARMGLGGAGTLSSGVAFKGWQPAETTATEYYNGTGWASSVNAATAAYYVGASAINLSTGALSIAGRATPGYLSTVEEYTQGAPISPTGAQASTLTTS